MFESPEKEQKKLVDPAVDGWEKTPDGTWARRTKTGVEYLGLIGSREKLTPDQIQAYYDRRDELKNKVQGGDKEALEELASLEERIGYLERYGPGVMGGL